MGHQWWGFRYPDEGIVTANELFVPTDRPVGTQSQDIIHNYRFLKLLKKIQYGNTNVMGCN